MPYYFGVSLTVVLQIFCGIHAYKNGRYSWLWIILFFPFVGCMIYLLVEVLPDLRSTGDQVAVQAKRTLMPEGVIKELKEKVDFCDTYDNRLALADEYIRCKQFGNAIDLLSKYSETGMHADDELLLGKLAYAHFMKEDYRRAKEILVKIRQIHGKFENQDLHLLLAVSLEKLNEKDACFLELEALNQYYTGEEARCRYAQILKNRGETARAKELFEKIIKKVDVSPAFYKREQLKWYEIAKKSISG
ncbi:MAG: hypothetical protein AB7S78_13345 [Candidatus Omnitrophota bacterium]